MLVHPDTVVRWQHQHERSQLNGFQQRFAKFVTDYMRLLEQLNVELRTVSPLTTVAIYCPPPL